MQPQHLEAWRFRLHHDTPQCTALLPAASMGVPSTRYPMSAAYDEAGNAEPGACGSAGILSLADEGLGKVTLSATKVENA